MRIGGIPGWVPAALLSLGLALLVAALYWPATGYDFVNFDDPIHLTENPLLREGMTREAVGKAFSSLPGEALKVGFYIPLTWLSFMADIELWGTSPRGFHLTNILLHAANMALLLLLLWRMTGSTWRSALAASLVALHPLRVESVAWITERKDVLSLFFLLLALAAYLAWARSGKKRWYASLCALFACSLLSKPMAVTFPLLLLLLDFWPLGRALPGRGARQWLPLLREKLPLFVASLSLAFFTLIIQKTPPRSGGVVTTLFSRLQHAVTAPLVYLRKTAWPDDLALRIDRLDPGVAWGDLLVGTGAILLISWLAWHARRERPWALFGWGWFLVALAPVSGLLRSGMGMQWINDRFTYLPHIGLMAALAWSAGSLSRKGKVSRFLVPAVAALCLLALAGTTRATLPAWKDTTALFSRAYEFSPDDPTVNLQLGTSLRQRGESARAEIHFRRYIEARPGEHWGHYNLAAVLEDQGRREEALAAYRAALAIDPRNGPALLRASRLLLALGRPAETLPLLQTCLDGEEDAFYLLTASLLMGQTLLEAGRETEAIPFLERTLAQMPNETVAHLGLAEIRLSRGEKEEAVAHWQEVTEDRPGTGEALFAQGRLMSLQGRGGEASELYAAALAAPQAGSDFPGLVSRLLMRGKR